MQSKRKSVGMLAVLALLCGLTSCSESVQGGIIQPADAKSDTGGFAFGDAKNHADGADSAVSDNGGAQDGAPTEDAVATGKLTFGIEQDDFGGTCDTLCALQINQNSQRKLLVKYTIGNLPVPGVLVEIVMKDPANTLGTVLTPNVATDETGLAGADVKAGNQVGTFEVLARVPDDPGAGTLEFQLHVASKAKGPLQITLHYAGGKSLSEFGAVKARLAKQTSPGQPACASIDLGAQTDAAGNPLQFAWESPPNLKWDKPWTINYPGFASWLPQDGSVVNFTIVGIASLNSTSTPLAGGCIDTGATVKWDPQSKTLQGDNVFIVVKDIPPRLKGVYDLTNYIDLVSILPDPVENVFKAMLDIVSDPVAGLLSLVCKLSNGSLDSLCKNIFDDPKSPNIKNLAQPFGGIIVKFLDAILLSFLPANVKSALATGADLSEILQNLRLDGTIEIMAEPDNTGFLDKKFTKENWNSVTYKWSLGQSCNPNDPKCGLKTFNIEAFQPDAIVGSFDLWRDAFKSEIKIAKHGLNIKWGALVNYVIQKQLLPLITFDPKNPSAPTIDSYAKLIKSLLAGKQCLVKDSCCEDFGKQLAGQQSLISADFLASTCELMITLGTGFLEAQLTSLDVNSGDPTKNSGLLLAADHCPIFEIDGDQYIDSLGSQSMMCEWDMTLTIGGTPQPIKSKFFANRQQ